MVSGLGGPRCSIGCGVRRLRCSAVPRGERVLAERPRARASNWIHRERAREHEVRRNRARGAGGSAARKRPASSGCPSAPAAAGHGRRSPRSDPAFTQRPRDWRDARRSDGDSRNGERGQWVQKDDVVGCRVGGPVVFVCRVADAVMAECTRFFEGADLPTMRDQIAQRIGSPEGEAISPSGFRVDFWAHRTIMLTMDRAQRSGDGVSAEARGRPQTDNGGGDSSDAQDGGE